MTATAPTPRDLLAEARTLIASPEAWTQGAAARDAEGEPVGVEHEDAVSWCATGAINCAMYRHADSLESPAAAAAGPQPGRDHPHQDRAGRSPSANTRRPTTYNDQTNHGCIVHAFDIAIADADRLCGKHSSGRSRGTERAR